MQDDENIELPKSKSQLKREMTALQALGTAIVELGARDLAKIPLPDDLAEAIHQAREIKSHGALRRQMQFIGRLMRNVDPAPIQQALDAIRLCGQQSASRFHTIEQWRDRLINEGQTALDEFISQHPQADRQQLRQLLLNAAKEAKLEKPPKSARSLFRLLREILESDE
jgi:ribosome-associated protein